MSEVVEKSANQLYKEYKSAGGTLVFTDFINREKAKGTFPLNQNLNTDVQKIVLEIKKQQDMSNSNKTFLGLPTSTLLIAGGVIVAAVAISLIVKHRKK